MTKLLVSTAVLGALCGASVDASAFIISPSSSGTAVLSSSSGRRRYRTTTVTDDAAGRRLRPSAFRIMAKESNDDDDHEQSSSSDGGSGSSGGGGGSRKKKKGGPRSSNLPLPNVRLSDMDDDRAARLVKAQADYDKLMSGPDPPFDYDAELAKVGVASPPELLAPDSSEATTESKVHSIETDLYAAIASGNYTTASDLKAELGRMHLDDCGSVLQTNLAFYRAFSAKDYDAMSDLWLHDASVTCIHPSHAPLVGASQILSSWKQMFGTTNKSFQHNVMEPTNVRLNVRGNTAILTCDEDVYTRRFVRGRKRQTELVNRLTATNIYRKVASKWHLVHHHSSWHAESDAARYALSGQMGGSAGGGGDGGGGGGGRPSGGSHRALAEWVEKQQAKKRGGGSGSGDGNGGSSGAQPPPPLSAEDVLGIPGNEGLSGKGYTGGSTSSQSGNGDSLSDMLGDAMGSSSSSGGGLSGGGAGSVEGSNGPVRRIFMGSLSDLLNGGLQDIIGNKGGAGGRSGLDGEPSLIRFNADDDDDDDEDDDDDDDHDNGARVIVRQVKAADDGESGDDKGEKKTNNHASAASGGGVPKDALRQNCISALRDLAEKGAISAKQKRVLLTDIIMCSARGEFSMVEVAYELLCGEGEEDSLDAAEEDFADQCRVFATALPDLPVSKREQ